VATKGINYDRAAQILCDAVLMGDEETSKKWKTTRRSIVRYRDRLGFDDKLRQRVIRLQTTQDERWASEIPAVLAEGMSYLRAAFESNLNSTEGRMNPETITALTGAIETLADIDLAREVIRTRLSANAEK
jgi:hypothetical protein